MTVEEVIELFRVAKPRHFLHLKALGLDLAYMGSGLYRDVYRIKGLPLVVKLPKHTDEDCFNHSRAEAKVVRRINRFKKYERLRKYMPKIHYFDHETGVMVVKFYKTIRSKFKFTITDLMIDLVGLLWPDGKEHDCDIHEENIGLDEHDNPVFIDLGYFLELGRG